MLQTRVQAAVLVYLLFSAAWPSTPGFGAELPRLESAAAKKISFRRDVWPIVKRHCWGCHSGTDAQGGLNMSSVADMLTGGDSGTLFEAGKPDESLLLEMIGGGEPEMPRQQPRLSAAKIHIWRQWIFAGARDDTEPAAARKVQIPDRYKFAPSITSVALSKDGQHLAVACRSEVVLIDVTGELAPRRLQTPSDLISHVEYSPDGKLLAVVGGSPARFGDVRFLQATAGELISSRRFTHDTLFRGSFSPDSQAIAVGGADGAVHIVPVDKRVHIRRLELHSDWVLDVAYTTDGDNVISGSRDKSAKVSSVHTGELLRTIDDSPELISSVAADQRFAVAAGRARQLVGYELKVALGQVEVAGTGNAFRPVTKRGQYAVAFESQPGEVLDIAISGDRKRIAVVGAYREVRVYQVEDRNRVARIGDLPSTVYSVAMNGDGTRLALGTKQGQVLLYQVPAGEQILAMSPVPVDGL